MISGQSNSDCGIDEAGSTPLSDNTTALSSLISMSKACQHLELKNICFGIFDTDVCPREPSFPSETTCQNFKFEPYDTLNTQYDTSNVQYDTISTQYNTMNSQSLLNTHSSFLLPSPVSSPLQTASTQVCSFLSDGIQSELHQLQQQQQQQRQQQQQHLQRYSYHHHQYLTSESDTYNEDFIRNLHNNHNESAENTCLISPTCSSGYNSTSDCRFDFSRLAINFNAEVSDSLSQEQDFDDVFHMMTSDTEQSFLTAHSMANPLFDVSADSAVSRSTSSSAGAVFNETDQSYGACDYEGNYNWSHGVYMKSDNFVTAADPGRTIVADMYQDPCVYETCSTECASYPQYLPNGNFPVAPFTVKKNLDLHQMCSRHGSPISDEGFDEPSIPEEHLPRVLNIQHFTDSDRDSHSSRSISSSPKDKRKIGGELAVPGEKERRKPGRKPGQVSNVLHLWEFMRDLLRTSDGRGIIEWVSPQDGVFRVLNSSEVARLWGEKKKNKKQMTYEKLSRSLRYSRLEGYFADLPKDKNYPKKLCFKFGAKAKDWR